MRTSLLLAVLALVAFGSCKSTPSSGPPPADSTPATQSQASAKATIGGKSISTVTRAELGPPLAALGHGFIESGSHQVGGGNEAFNVGFTKTKSDSAAWGHLYFVRPTSVPGGDTHVQVAPGRQQESYYTGKGCATYVEADALVAICIDGDTAGAKALLDQLVKR